MQTPQTPHIGPIRRLAAALGCPEASDAELLSRFLSCRDEVSFAALVRRHGPMVLGVCRCVLRCDADAEDAFQAVFLSLATRAASIRDAASLAGWLHGVAYRTALKARVAAGRRRAAESRAERGAEALPPDLSWAEAQEAIHASLDALPDRYRVPLILCYLNGRTQDDAARALGLSRSGLKKRLEYGRALLRDWLVRRGLGPAAALLAAAWPGAAAAALPAALERSVMLFAAGTAASVRVLALVEGGRAALPTLKLVTAAVLVLGAACLAAFQATGKPAAAPRLAVAPPAAPTDQHGDPLPANAVARLGTVRFRSDGWINQVGVVPGGKQILGLGSRAVILWDAATGREVRRFAGPTWRRTDDGAGYGVRIPSFAVSPDGRTLAAGTADGSKRECPILLFDLATGRKLGEWPGHRSDGFGGNDALAFVTPTLLASSGADGTARLWDVPGKREARRLATTEKGRIHQLVPSPDGKLVFGGGWDGKGGSWTAWETASGKAVHREAGLPGGVVRVAVSPDGSTLAACIGGEGPPEKDGHSETRLYSVPGWKERRRWRAHEGSVPHRSAVAFAPDGKTIATGGADHQVRRWDVSTGKQVGTVIRPHPYANSVLYLDADTLLTFGSQQALRFWDPATGKPKREFAGAESHLKGLAYSPDGRLVASGGGGGDSTIRVWEAATGRPVAHLKAAAFDVTCLCFSPDGRRILSADSGGTASLWDWEKGGDPVRTFVGHRGWLHAVAFRPDGKRLATGDEAGVIRVWDPSGDLIQKLEGHVGQVTALAFAPDGRTLYSACWDHGIRQWDLATGKTLRAIKGVWSPTATADPVGHTSVVTSLALSPGGRWLYSGSYDHTICVWEAATGRLGRVLKGTERGYSSVNAMALSPDGMRLAAAIGDEGQESSVHVWDVPRGEKLSALPGHGGSVTQLAYSPNGRRLASASTDTTVPIWDTSIPARRGEALDQKTQARIWDDLGSDDPKAAYAAVCRWAAAGDGAVSGLKTRLKTSAPVDTRKVPELVRQLDSDDFAERERASRALADLGPPAAATVREALDRSESLEVKARLRRLLGAWATADRRSGNALEVLEMIGTPEAERLLNTLDAGAAARLRKRR